MEEFIFYVDNHGNPIRPYYNYIGNLIHHVIMLESSPLEKKKIRKTSPGIDDIMLFTTFEQMLGYKKLYVYKDGKRVTSKIVESSKPIMQESVSLLLAVIMDIRLGYIR